MEVPNNVPTRGTKLYKGLVGPGCIELDGKIKASMRDKAAADSRSRNPATVSQATHAFAENHFLEP